MANAFSIPEKSGILLRNNRELSIRARLKAAQKNMKPICMPGSNCGLAPTMMAKPGSNPVHRKAVS